MRSIKIALLYHASDNVRNNKIKLILHEGFLAYDEDIGRTRQVSNLLLIGQICNKLQQKNTKGFAELPCRWQKPIFLAKSSTWWSFSQSFQLSHHLWPYAGLGKLLSFFLFWLIQRLSRSYYVCPIKN